MRFKIKGVEYESATLEDVTLADVLRFPGQMAELRAAGALGAPESWNDAVELVARLALIDDLAARGRHPDAIWAMAVTVWASRRLAGEDVTVAQAADFRWPADFEALDEPTPTKARPKAGRAKSGDHEPSDATP